jgi:hypothetical protein
MFDTFSFLASQVTSYLSLSLSLSFSLRPIWPVLIWMQGLLDFDWLGAGQVVSPIGLQQGEGEMGNYGTSPYTICRGELWVDLAGFFLLCPGLTVM